MNILSGWAGRARRNPASAAVSLLLLGLLGWAGWAIFSWAVLRAEWPGAAGLAAGPAAIAAACQAQSGACWGGIAATWHLILFGRYPIADQWRPALASLIMLGLVAASLPARNWGRWLAAAWGIGLVAALVLMGGGVAGLSPVATDLWNGLPLSLLLAALSLLGAAPLALALALGRELRGWPVVRGLCVLFIEIVRGVPLVAWLFIASVMLPLFLAQGAAPPRLVRGLVALSLFVAAYLAEIIRGGLRALGPGQREAAAALGLSGFQALRLVVLPQALRLVVPPGVNLAAGLLKDTSLVIILGLYDLVGTGKLAVADPLWQPYWLEVYLLVGVIYLLICTALMRTGAALERTMTAPGA